MSAVSSRSITTKLVGAAILSTARTADAILSTTVKHASAVSRDAARLAERALDATPLEIPALPAARAQADSLEARLFQQFARSNADAIAGRKAAALAAIAEAPFVAADADVLLAAVSRLEGAQTLAQVERERKALRKVVEQGHSEAWMAGLRDACTRAFEKTDFRPLDVVMRSPLDIIVSAVNRDGKVMVSELSVDCQGAPRLQTEVVNGCGSECEGLLEAFDHALDEEIRGSAPVRRKTGGVCQLDAAKAFIASKAQRPALRSESSGARTRTSAPTAQVKKR